MNNYKYTYMAVLIFVAVSLASAVAAGLGVVSGNVAAISGSFAFAAVLVIGFYHWRTCTSIDFIIENLNSGEPARIRKKNIRPLTPLGDAITEFAANSLQKAGASEEQLTDLNLQIQLLQRQKQNAEAIIYSIRDTVIVTDAFDRLIMASASAQELFNFDANDAVGKPVDDLIPDREFIRLIQNARRSNLFGVKHEVAFTTNGQERTYDCLISCVRDEKDITCGVVAVLHDITREKEISNAKNDFVGHVSHELKTPLASINAYAEMLIDGEADSQEKINEFCTIIQTQAQRLNRLIEDILNISRIESGLTKINRQPTSLALLMTDAIKMIESYASEKNITVNAQSPIIFDQVNIDRDMMSQVVVNLLSNAVKYTPRDGSITITIEVNEADGLVQANISDTGVGIPPDDLEHVFDKFYRVEQNKKYAKGTGLGLNLVKQIVEKVHGGKVFVTSTPGEGSTFGFELPLALGQTAETV